MPPSRPRRTPRQPPAGSGGPLATDAAHFVRATDGSLLMDEAEPMMASLRSMRQRDRPESFAAFTARFGPRDPERLERLKMLYNLTVERARTTRAGRPVTTRTTVTGRRGP